MLSGVGDGTLAYFENVESGFVQHVGASNPLDGVDVGAVSAPALADLDADGDADLVVGEQLTGAAAYFENTGTPQSATFTERVGAENPLEGETVITPTLVDLDADGDLDLVSGTPLGVFEYFENTGTPASADFVERVDGLNPFDRELAGYAAAPTFADLDADGDFDLVVGNSMGEFTTFIKCPEAAWILLLASGTGMLGVLQRRHRRRGSR